MKNNILEKTTLLLRNRSELLKNKKNKIASIKNITKKNNININILNLNHQKINNYSKILESKKIMSMLKKKIQKLDPWYAELCKLKELPKTVKKLAINTSCTKTLEHWYIYLTNQNKHLTGLNAWEILKQKLSTITNKKITLVIENKNEKNVLTPYEWFKKIYQEKISEEYMLIIKDPNIQELKKKFNVELYKDNINLI